MELTAKILTGLVALIHLYVLWIEMFAWETRGRSGFAGIFAPELFTPTKAFAANQGLYNGFLSAGLIWTFFITDHVWKTNISFFFLTFIIVAGTYGAVTGLRKTLYIQAIPALLAFLCVLYNFYTAQ